MAETMNDQERERYERVIAGLNAQLTEQFELSTKYGAEAERLRERVAKLTRERDAQYDENVNRIAAEGAAILRAEAAERKLAQAEHAGHRALSEGGE